MRKPLALTAAALLSVLAAGCATDSPAPPISTASSASASGSVSPSASAEPSASGDVSPSASAASIDPALQLPDDRSVVAPGTHVAAGTWGFLMVAFTDNSTPNPTTTDSLVGVRINGLWSGPVGSLADRTINQPPGQAPIDLTTATPFYLSYSYVVVEGDAQSAPKLSVLPTTEGTLFEVTSALVGARNCPDYPGPLTRGLGQEVRNCLVSLTSDGARPTALLFSDDLSALDRIVFFDAPEATELPA